MVDLGELAVDDDPVPGLGAPGLNESSVVAIGCQRTSHAMRDCGIASDPRTRSRSCGHRVEASPEVLTISDVELVAQLDQVSPSLRTRIHLLASDALIVPKADEPVAIELPDVWQGQHAIAMKDVEPLEEPHVALDARPVLVRFRSCAGSRPLPGGTKSYVNVPVHPELIFECEQEL